MPYYAVVTFGTPTKRLSRVYKTRDGAYLAARRARGSGTCTESRVYVCLTEALARSADISVVREGEGIEFVP